METPCHGRSKDRTGDNGGQDAQGGQRVKISEKILLFDRESGVKDDWRQEQTHEDVVVEGDEGGRNVYAHEIFVVDVESTASEETPYQGETAFGNKGSKSTFVESVS